ncbi:Pentatricopeptide repeat-containing protein At5g57250, mitochondrial [Linum perenne]
MRLPCRLPLKFSRSLCCSSSPCPSWSLQILLKRGFAPTLHSINQFLLFLSRTHRFSLITHFFSQMSRNQILGDSNTHSILAWTLLKLNRFEEAESFLKTHMSKSLALPNSRIWDCLIRLVCINGKDPEKAFSLLRESLTDYGVLPSSFTFSSLIHSFSSQGKLSRAIEVLELMTGESVKYPYNNFVCSSVISGFSKIGKPELAFGFFQDALSVGALKPNVVTYTALATALSNLSRVNELSELACRMVKEGLALDIVFYSTWISGYCFQGMLMDALRKHWEMARTGIGSDAICDTILIDGLTKQGNVEKAVGFLLKMVETGLQPDLVTYSTLMLGFCRKGKVVEACSLFETVKNSGIKLDEYVYAILVDGLCRQGNFKRVSKMLDEMEIKAIRPSIRTYNTLINGLCSAGKTTEADELSKGIDVDIVTYSTLLHGYIEEANAVRILEIIKRSKDAGIRMDVIMCNILIRANFMVGAFEEAYNLYKGMQVMDLVADSVTYCTMIDGYCKVDRVDEALEIFDEFRRKSISSVACYNCLISWLCKKNMVDMATEVFFELIEKGLRLDVALTKNNGVLAAYELIMGAKDNIPDMDMVDCSIVVDGLIKGGHIIKALDICDWAEKRMNLRPSEVTYATLIDSLCREGYLMDAQQLVDRMVLSGYKRSAHVYNSLLNGYCLTGQVEEALKILRGMDVEHLTPDQFAVSAVINGYCQKGDMEQALRFFFECQLKARSPDFLGFLFLIKGLRTKGRMEEARSILREMLKSESVLELLNNVDNLAQTDSIYTFLVSLCDQGSIKEAVMVLDEVSAMIYPHSKRYGLQHEQEDLRQLTESMAFSPVAHQGRTDLNVPYCDMEGVDNTLEYGYDPKGGSESNSFDLYSSLIVSHCSKGELGEANRLAKEMLINIVGK